MTAAIAKPGRWCMVWASLDRSRAIIVGILWAGAAIIATRALVRFVVGSRGGDAETADEVTAGSIETVDSEAEDGAAATSSAEDDAPPGPLDALSGSIVGAAGAVALTGAGVAGAPLLGAAGAALVFVGALPIAGSALRTLRDEKRLDFEGLICVETYLFLAVGMPLLAAFDWTVFTAGRALSEATRRRVRESTAEVFAEVGESVWLVRDGVEVQLGIDAVEVGDLMVVGAGDSVAIDGRLVEGRLGVDQRALTGESKVRELGPGDPVLAATFVVHGRATVRAERTGRDTYAARIQLLLDRTDSYEQQLDARMADEAERSVRPTLAVATVGLLAGGVRGLLGGLWTNSMENAWLGSPLSMVTTIGEAAREAILIKDGRSLELLAGVDTVVFDKTGTLTLDAFEVSAIRSAEGWSEDAALALAAALEARQQHPIARAIRSAAEARGLNLPVVGEQVADIGRGLRAVFEGRPAIIGGPRMIAGEGISLDPDVAGDPAATEARGCTVVHAAVGGAHIATFELTPAVRPDAAQIVEYLEGRDLDVMMLTGDEEGPAQALAQSLGIDRVFARTLPEDKARILQTLQAEGRSVCFVGDGINDALAMRHAHVSVSMSGASTAAIESAQILLQRGSLAQLRAVFEIADRFGRDQRFIIGSSRLITVGSGVGVMFLGLGLGGLLVVYVGSLGLSLGAATLPRLRRIADPQPGRSLGSDAEMPDED